MKKPDQDTINALFDAVEASDNNASITIEVLQEEFDLTDLRRVVSVPKDLEENQTETVQAIDPLDLYLHSVFHGGEKCINALITTNDEAAPSASKVVGEEKLYIAQGSASMDGPLIFDGANDVCWAVLSNNDNALTNLRKAHENNGFEMDVNAREAVAFNGFSLRNDEAKKHTPLDLAIMKYVAERRGDQNTKKMIEGTANSIKNEVSQILPQFEGVNKLGIILPEQQDQHLFAPATSEKIRDLIEMGAIGSDAAYFPAVDETLDDPFNNDSGLEIMSLKEFCMENAHVFEPDIYAALVDKAEFTPELTQ